MTIIRIIQANSITHTEFELLPDYKVMPAGNFELAKEWAALGLLSEFDALHLMMLENQQNYYAAIRQIMKRENASGLQLVSRRDESPG